MRLIGGRQRASRPSLREQDSHKRCSFSLFIPEDAIIAFKMKKGRSTSFFSTLSDGITSHSHEPSGDPEVAESIPPPDPIVAASLCVGSCSEQVRSARQSPARSDGEVTVAIHFQVRRDEPGDLGGLWERLETL